MPERAQPIVSAFTRLIDEIVGVLPEMMVAAALLIAGWLIARLLRALTMRSADLINRGLAGLGVRLRARVGGVGEPTIKIIAGIVFWVVFLFFLASAAGVVGLDLFAGWLDRLVAFLPQIISGVLIIFAGVVLANIARDAVLAASGRLSETQRTLLARATQIATLLVLVVVGVDQIGIDITVIIIVLAVVLGGVLGGMAIAFGLGARSYVSNLIGAHYLNRDFRVGERIRIAGMEGAVVEITPVSVVLSTGEGRLNVPARLFAEEAVLLLMEEDDRV